MAPINEIVAHDREWAVYPMWSKGPRHRQAWYWPYFFQNIQGSAPGEFTYWSLGNMSLYCSFRPSDAYVRQYNIPTLLQMMVCRPFGAKPLSEPVLPYCQHSKNKVVKWTTLGLSNWCQKRTPQSRPKLVIEMSRRMTTLMSSQKQPESRQMTTFLLVSLPYDDLVITLERLNDKPQIVKWWSCD